MSLTRQCPSAKAKLNFNYVSNLADKKQMERLFLIKVKYGCKLRAAQYEAVRLSVIHARISLSIDGAVSFLINTEYVPND